MSRKIEYKTEAEPRAMAGSIPVFCSHDELLPLNKIIPNPKNPNGHPKAQVKLLAEIIAAQGWRAPITISTRSGFVVKGHGRLMAAQLLETETAPVDYQNYNSEAEEYADLVADNRLAELSEINNTMLADILSDIDTGEIPLDLTGYTEDDLEGILNAIAGAEDAEPNDQDNENEQPLPAMAKLGDLWLLGPHRLICGDATDRETIDRLMNGEKGAMVHTDPPYNVSYNGGAGTKQKDGSRTSRWREEEWDVFETDEEFVEKLLTPVFENYVRVTEEKAAFYIWHSLKNRRLFDVAMDKAKLKERQYLIWYKDKLVLGHCDYQVAHEPCFYASKDGVNPEFYGDRTQESVLIITSRQNGNMETVIGNGVLLSDDHGAKLYISRKQPKGKKVRYLRTEPDVSVFLYDENASSTVWQVDRETEYMHPTQKPVELSVRAIENSSQPGEIVLDFFGGSGSTLLGAEATGRRCYTTELDPQYADVIVSRYVMQTGNIGVTCIRDGKEYNYIDMVRQWAKENGKEEEIKSMKTPVVVIQKKKAEVE